MLKRCTTCRCVLRFRPALFRESLCPHELKRDFIHESLERGDFAYYRHRMNGYATYPIWGISYTCPGCGLIGTDSPRYTEAEVQAIVEKQNATADEAERAGEPSRWQEVVWSRMERGAQNLTDVCLSCFPDWQPYIRPFPNAPADPAMETFEYVRVLDLPSEHPRLSDPLQVSVQPVETLVVWGDWHTHINARDDDPADREHLERTVDLLTLIVNEELLIGSDFREGRVIGGFSVYRGSEISPLHARPKAGDADRVMLRSWRGTYDRQVFPA